MAKIAVGSNPVLIVLIGWARNYDGTEAIVGGHKWLQESPGSNGELQAFSQQEDGYFRCGIGKGKISEESADIVFIARNPLTSTYEVVALYLACEWEAGPDNWHTAQSRNVLLFPVSKRVPCTNWPPGKGMRRWAYRINSKGAAHKELLSSYRQALRGSKHPKIFSAQEVDQELSAFEGAEKRRFVKHRKREGALRAAKICDVLRKRGGRLACEVPNCGFDFFERYGEKGLNFAIVHHKKPLSSSPINGRKTSLADLAIVCANCHAMIHRGAACRKMGSLIEDQS